MIITKKYYLLIDNNKLRVPITNIVSSVKVTDGYSWFEVDTMQECIEELLSNSIVNFEIPIEISRLENIPTYYQKAIYSNNILTKYEDGLPIYEDHILTSYVEMPEDEKQNQGLINKVAFLKWQQVEKNNKIKFIKRFHIRMKDAFSGGLLASKFNEIIAKRRPFYNVDKDHNLDVNGEWVDVYFKKINPQDIETINSYLSAITGSKLEDFNEL